MTTSPIVISGKPITFRGKLANLVDNVTDRLNQADNPDTDRFYVLDALLDRLAELVYDITSTTGPDPIDTPPRCGRCHRLAATSRVTAGTPGTDQYHSEAVCIHCTLPAITLASLTGPVSVHPIPPATPEVDA